MAGTRGCVPGQGQVHRLCLGQRAMSRLSACVAPKPFQGHAATLASLAHDAYQPAGPIWFLINPKVRWRKQPSREPAVLDKIACKHANTSFSLQPGKNLALLLAVSSKSFPHGQTAELWLVTKLCLLQGTEERQVGQRPRSKGRALREGAWQGAEEEDVMRSSNVQLHPPATPASSLWIANSHFVPYSPLHRIFFFFF